VRAFSCSRCGSLVGYEDGRCVTCQATLGYALGADRLLAVDPGGTVEHDGATWRPCSNASWGCNWLLLASDDAAQCRSCRLTIERPDATDTLALEQLALAGYAKRRLLYQLHEHGLAVTPYYEQANGLGFRLLSSRSTGEPVTIGHADGVVTIDLSEVDHAYRESLRVRLGEPYRTMLGHFRHEIGHYYWQVLVADSPWLDRCRRLFGDEQASYAEALERHYRLGAPASWNDAYISEYATMHPWEDFAETWAHYLHITDVLETVASYGMQLTGVVAEGVRGVAREALRTAPPLSTRGYHHLAMADILALWHPLAIAFNQVNRSMGKTDLYPFTITTPVREKLAFVHEIVGGR
jgi:hypothetical protein